MDYNGIENITETINDNIEEHSKRIANFLIYINKNLPYESFDSFFMNSDMNKGFSSMQDMFNSYKIENLLIIDPKKVNLYSFLFNVELYSNLILENHHFIFDRTILHKKYIPNYFKAVSRALQVMGYQPELQNNKLSIIKSIALVINEEKPKEIINKFYQYSNNNDLNKKRILLTTLANVLEPLRNKYKEIDDLEHFVFNIFNNYSIRHNNKSQVTLTDDEYHVIYNLTFNIGVSIYEYIMIKKITE